mgnify:CR=1 FL=1
MNIIKVSKGGRGKKWKVSLPSGKTVQFGARGYSDYTKHKDPLRMKRYVVRHGGASTSSNVPAEVQKIMLKRVKSTKEKWSAGGVGTAGFWSRWLLWSFPDIKEAAKYTQDKGLKGKYKIIFTP